MQLLVQRGLPSAPKFSQEPKLAFDKELAVSAPLTSGFARTGYELDQMEARQQKLDYGKAERNTHAELRPLK